MKAKFWIISLVVIVVILVPAGVVLASQEEVGLNLRLDRNFGYGGFGKIQGRFTLKIADPPEGLEEVQFFMDGEPIGSAGEEPFEFKFHTSEFPEGERVMSAEGVLSDGIVLSSNRIRKEFLSSEQAWSETEGVLIPMLVGVGVLTLIGVGVPFLISNKKNFVLGKYGAAGGVVCPRCALPFSRSIMAPNLLIGKLVRCPHCGKNSILPRSSAVALKEAEERFLLKDGTTPVRSKGDLLKQIEDSRFEE